MSNSLVPLNVVKIYDDVTNINQERKVAVIDGGQEVSYQITPASNNSITSTIQFSIVPPSPQVIVDRKFQLQARLRLDFVAETLVNNTTVLQNQADALRAYPLSRMINSLNISINNSSVSVNLSDVLPALMRYNNPANQRMKELSTTPHFQDVYQRYEDALAVTSNMNPLGSASNSAYEWQRGAFPVVEFSNANVAVAGTGKTAYVIYDLSEELMLSPLLFGDEDGAGLTGIKNLTITLNLKPNVQNYLWSSATNANRTMTSITASFVNPPQIVTRNITPKAIDAIPMAPVYNYHKVENYPTDSASLAPNASRTVSTNTIQLSTIPSRFYVFAQRQVASFDYGKTDTFLRIDNVSVTFGNRTGLLSNATRQNLYMISKKNGYSYGYEDWCGITHEISANANYGLSGSVLCIDPARDLGLDSLSSAGLASQVQLQMSVGLTNINQTDTFAFTLWVVVVSEGSMVISNGDTVLQLGILSQADILNAQPRYDLNYSDIQKWQGGDFFSSLKQNLSKLGNFVQKHKAISRGADVLARLDTPYAPAFGVVRDLAQVVGAGAPVGGAMLGGAKISKKSLAHRLR